MENLAELQPVFDPIFRLIEADIGTVPSARPMIGGMAAHLAEVQTLAGVHAPNRLPVCDYIPEALRASGGPHPKS